MLLRRNRKKAIPSPGSGRRDLVQRAVSLIAGGFWRQAFTKPINDRGKQRQEQVNPALRLPAGRYGQC